MLAVSLVRDVERSGEAGFDVMHFNVHKTFSTPHGGGGPGAGPVGVGDKLLPFLPSPRVLKAADGSFRLERPHERPSSIGRLRSFVGNTGVLVRAYAYLRAHGGSGLRQVSDDAVLAANYLKYAVDFDGNGRPDVAARPKDNRAPSGAGRCGPRRARRPC